MKVDYKKLDNKDKDNLEALKNKSSGWSMSKPDAKDLYWLEWRNKYNKCGNEGCN